MKVLVNQHTELGKGPFHATMRMQPSLRIELFDVRSRLRAELGEPFTRYPKTFYISDHTTAGYLDQRLAEALDHDAYNIQDYLKVFQKLFPPAAGYIHDKLHLRTELSKSKRASEPLNGDSHLTFMGGGLSNCASYDLSGDEPVWFVELDGVHAGGTRTRRTTVIAYQQEEVVQKLQVQVEASPHPIDAQNLRDPRLGFIDQLERLVREHRVSFGRFDVSLPAGEHDVGLTVNEYETLLMTHDLREVLQNPLHFMARMAKSALQAPHTVPAKALNFAQYDAVQLFNKVVDRVGIRRSQVERLINWALAVPVSRFLCMKRGISFPILDRQGKGTGEIGWGTYQSPILVQWRGAARTTRSFDVTLVRFL